MRGGYGRGGGGGRGNGRGGDFDNRGRVSLWENDGTWTPRDGGPDYTGKYVDQDGKTWYISLWENRDARGNAPVLSGSIRDPDEVGGGRGGGRSGGRERGSYGRWRDDDRQRDSGRGRDDDPRGERGGFRDREPERDEPPRRGRVDPDLDDEVPF